MKYSFALILSSLVLMSCAPTPNVVSQPADPKQPLPLREQALDAGGGLQSEYNPKVDIVFVVDDSDSMGKHEKHVTDNLAQFAQAFQKNTAIDAHIGVVSVFDSRQYGQDASHPVHIYYPLGQLRPLKSGKGEILNEHPYLTSVAAQDVDVLKATVNLGEDHYRPGMPQSGPEKEEMFSPVIALLGGQTWASRFPYVGASYDPNIEKVNAGFYRPDAHLVIITITDGKDLTRGVTPTDMAEFLDQLKPNGGTATVTYIGVLSPVDEPACATDPDGKPANIEALISILNSWGAANRGKTSGREISLCSPNFGKQIAELGQDIKKKISRMVIPVNSIPDRNRPIKVSYGSQTIPPDDQTGWSYDSDQRAFIINEGVELKAEPGAHLTLNFTSVNMENAATGHVHSGI